MSQNFTYWTSVLKRLGYLLLAIIGIFLLFKLVIFYTPFLIAFIISIMMEPAIKFIMKKTKLSRRASSIIVFIITFGIILGLLTWGITTLISESTHLLEGLNGYYNKADNLIQSLIKDFNFDKIKVSNEILEIFQNSATSFLGKISVWVQEFLDKFISWITAIPIIAIYFVVTILALYFICTDKIYMLDELEHHLPETWVKKIGVHLRDLIKTLGGYLKSQVILIFISFIISLIGLYIIELMNFGVGYPLLIAIGIAFVDALPILGSGSVMVPWAVISSLDGNLNLGISIVTLWIIMSVVRQLIEPKIVSRKYSVFTLFLL